MDRVIGVPCKGKTLIGEYFRRLNSLTYCKSSGEMVQRCFTHAVSQCSWKLRTNTHIKRSNACCHCVIIFRRHLRLKYKSELAISEPWSFDSCLQGITTQTYRSLTWYAGNIDNTTWKWTMNSVKNSVIETFRCNLFMFFSIRNYNLAFSLNEEYTSESVKMARGYWC